MKNYASKEQKLQAKVEAVNINNEFTNEFTKILIQYLTPWINRKILKTNSEYLKGIQDGIQSITNELLTHFKTKYPYPKCNINFWRTQNDLAKYSKYSLNYTIKTTIHVDDPYTDEEATNIIYIADFDPNNLSNISKLHNPPKLKTNYTFNELKFQQQLYFDITKTLEKHKIELFNFIEDIELKKYA